MAAKLEFQPLNNRRNLLGEGPFWDGESGRLYLVDIVRKEIVSLDASGGDEIVWRMPEPVSAAIPRRQGGLVVTLPDGAYILEAAEETLERLAETEPDISGNRSNEARTDPWGRLWLGTMQNNIGADGSALPVRRSSGTLSMLDGRGNCRRLLSGIGISNTLCWSPERDRLYFADSLAAAIYVFDFDPETANLSNRRVFSDISGIGVPDGSAIDEEGYLWNARWGGGCIIRFAPDGSVDQRIDVPVVQPTSCVFGGTDRTTLYVTSARHGLAESQLRENPLEGATLSCEAGVRGEACTRFIG